ncbi:hypothetical protein [Ferrimonas marina]|uniref:Uncharacterized protein n=1 Tax=Ferrimonas marina TaxID=299255 RepID=A0A1M5RU23_9GAMM|nr:hypothetical protein [Ferrimonas marina]SHH29815.1 hypothetical protein SAMN02745129_1754 [Ferrimonas marina]
MARANRRRKALHSLSERRRMCRKRTHMRVVHRSKMFTQLIQAEELVSSDAAL